MEGGAHFSSKRRHTWSSDYARPEFIEHKEISVKNDYYSLFIIILGTARLPFPWEHPEYLYDLNPTAFIEKKKNPSMAVRKINA